MEEEKRRGKTRDRERNGKWRGGRNRRNREGKERR